MPIVVQMQTYGRPEVLQAVERPAPFVGGNDVLIRVALAGVNRADLFIRSGEWKQAGPWPYVPGLEACGIVERVGERVGQFAPGDRVITMMQRLGGIHGERDGGYQELVLANESTLARVPDALDLETAAALGLPAVTASIALALLEVNAGDRVLVHAGSSAVGIMAIQLARAQGAHVVASGTREEKFELIQQLGAEQVVSTRRPDWHREIGQVDRVFELVGTATFASSVSLLKTGGKLVFVGGTSGGELALSGWDLMRPVTLTGYSSEALTRDGLELTFQRLSALVERGKLAVHGLHRYPLAEAREAHADMEAGRVAGRVVLDPHHAA